MTKNKGVDIKIEANTKQAAQGIDKITEQLNKMAKDANSKLSTFSKLGSAVSGVQAAFSMVTGAMKAAKDAVMDCVNAYQTQANAETQLETAVRNNPYLRDESVQKLKDYASHLQSIGTIGDETLIPLMAQLASAGRSETEIMDIMSAALDASASGAISLESAVKSLSKSYSGEAGELANLNPKVKELTKEQLKNGEAVKLIAESYDGMAESTANATGGFQKLKNSWGDFLEVLGKPINAVLNPIAVGFSAFVDKISGFFKKLNDKWDDFAKKVHGNSLPAAAEINFEVKNEDIEKAQKKVQRLQEIVNSTNTAAGVEAVNDFSDALDSLGDSSEETARRTLRAFRSFRELENSLKDAEEAKKKLEDIKNGVASVDSILQDRNPVSALLKRLGLSVRSSADGIEDILSNVETIITNKTAEINEQIQRTIAGGVTGAAISAVDTGEIDEVEKKLVQAQKNLTALQDAKARQDEERREKEAAELRAVQNKELTQTQEFVQKQLAIVTNGKAMQDEMIEQGFKKEFDWSSYDSSIINAYQQVYSQLATLSYSGSKEVAQQALEQLKEWYANALAEQASAIQEAAEEGDEQVKDVLGDEIKRIKAELDGLLGDDLFDRKAKINLLEGLKAQLEEMQKDVDPATDAFKKLEDAIRGVEYAIDELSTGWEKMDSMDRFEYLEKKGEELASSISSAFSLAGETIDNNLSADLSKLEALYDQGLISEEAYNAQKAAMEKKAAKEKYKTQMAEWALNLLATQSSMALAIAKALATEQPPLSYIDAAVTGAAAAAQLAAQIAAKPVPPSYATGGVVGGFSGASVGGDNTYIHARNGEMMLNAAQQRNLFDMANTRRQGESALNVEIKNYRGSDTSATASLDGDKLTVIVDSIVKRGLSNGSYNGALVSAQNSMNGTSYTS